MTELATASSPVADNEDPTIDGTAVVVPPVEAIDDANPAAPSTVDAQDAKAPADLLSVVKAAVEATAEPEPSSSPKDDLVEPEAAAPEITEMAAEDDADLPFHNHPRWKAVLAERDTLRDPAEKYGMITGFMQEHDLSGEEMAEGYEVMALLKSGDPDKLAQAREWFSERLNALDGMLGNVLPEDLQERIYEGLLDEEGAMELAQARATAALRNGQEATRLAGEASRNAQQAGESRIREIAGAVESWEARIKASDPDYSKKAEMVEVQCQVIAQREGKVPHTSAEATALADRALAEVNRIMKSALPKPRAIAPDPIGQSTVTTQQPNTLRGAIEAALSG